MACIATCKKACQGACFVNFTVPDESEGFDEVVDHTCTLTSADNHGKHSLFKFFVVSFLGVVIALVSLEL